MKQEMANQQPREQGKGKGKGKGEGQSLYIFTLETPVVTKAIREEIDKLLKDDLPENLFRQDKQYRLFLLWLKQLSVFQKSSFYANAKAMLDEGKKNSLLEQLEEIVGCGDEKTMTKKSNQLKLVPEEAAPTKALLKIRVCLRQLQKQPAPPDARMLDKAELQRKWLEKVANLSTWLEAKPETLTRAAIFLGPFDGQRCSNELKLLVEMEPEERTLYLQE